MTNFQRTAAWLAACGKKPGSAEDFSCQAGVDIEEFLEGLSCLELNLPADAMNEARAAMGLLSSVATLLKRGTIQARIAEGKRAEFLDALCDREVTGSGLAFLAGFDKDGADQEVLRSNDSKLVNGKAVFLPGGKIAKPDGWIAPNLAPYI